MNNHVSAPRRFDPGADVEVPAAGVANGTVAGIMLGSDFPDGLYLIKYASPENGTKSDWFHTRDIRPIA